MSESNVFVGPGNIAGNAMYIANALKLVGIKATSFSYSAHPFGYPCNIDKILFEDPVNKRQRNFFLKIIFNKYLLSMIWAVQKLFLFFYAIFKYDTFIFISNETFFKSNIDLSLLKIFEKKIAFLFVGCPERDPKDTINLRDRGMCSFCVDKGLQNYLNCYNGNKKREKIEYISRNSNIIFSHRDTTSFIIDKSKIRLFYSLTDLKIDKEVLINKFRGTKEILISHIPSNSLLKGTDSVIEAINQLKLRYYQFQYFSDPINHSEVSNLLKHTQILIDQFSVGHGLLGVEGLANGCVVICRTAKWFKEDFPELPMVSCEPEELSEILIDLITNPEKMLGIALKSFDYYKKFHTPEVVGNYYKNTLNLK
jgi:hypothetical protein